MFCTSSECRVSMQLCLVYLQGNLSFTGQLWINSETHRSFFVEMPGLHKHGLRGEAWRKKSIKNWIYYRKNFGIEEVLCHAFYFFLFIVHLYPPPPLLGIYLVLWASWPWGIARSRRKIVGDKYIYNGTHSSMSLTLSQWNDGPETFCGLLCCGKQALMLGRPGDLRVCECAPSVSLPYKSDHEWKEADVMIMCSAGRHLSRGLKKHLVA